MRHRRVTVLGASGFVGRYIVKHLAHEGAVIAAVSRHADYAGFLRPMGDVGQIEPIDADILRDDALDAAVAGAEIIVNAVGLLYERGRQNFDAIHVRLPARIAAAAKKAGAKQILHISAIGADPQSPAAYGRSKAAGEAALKAAFPDAIVLRPALVFGPEDEFFNRFACYARYLPVLPLIGGGTMRFQPVYVRDVASAVAAALNTPAAKGKVYELAGPRVYSFKELMEIILRVTRRSPPLVSYPLAAAMVQAWFLEFLPKPPLTRDQLHLMERDNVPTPGMPGLPEFGIGPTALEVILPTYLQRFRNRGLWRPRTT